MMKMNWSGTWLLAVMFAIGIVTAHAQLLLLPEPPQVVFAGNERALNLSWHNTGNKTAEADVRARIFQTSSATAVPVSEVAWKKLQVLPGQTAVESAQLDFPAVKAETKYLVQWLENTNRIIGRTEVLVYPTNLLAELKPLAGDEPLGVFDPQNQLKPLLKNLKVEFSDLENSGLENFSGKLAIIGPFQSKAQMRDGLANQVQALAKKGAAIVWLQPPPGKRDKLLPSFYSVLQNTNAVVIVQSEWVVNLPSNPQSQINLIYFCRLTLQPQPLTLPDLSP